MIRVAIFASLFVAATAVAETKQFAGVDLVQSKSDASCDYIENTIINPLYSRSCDDSSNGYHLVYGLESSGNIYELGYMDAGEVESKAYFYGFPGEQTSYPQITVVGKFGVSGLTLSYKRVLEISDNSGIYAALGAFFYKAEAKDVRIGAGSGSDGFSVSDSGISPRIGIGYRYRWFDLSYSLVKKVDIKELGDTDMNQLALGIKFKF